MTDFPLCPDALASEIDIPLEQWPGNCHGIAQAILQMVPVDGMRLARGHYHGYVSRKSVYRGGPQQHSWLVAADGRILDPTRWAMESPDKPYIYLGINDEYDEAGLQLTSRIPPLFPTGKPDPRAVALSNKSLEQINRIARAIRSSEVTETELNSKDLGRLASSLAFALKCPPDHHDDPVELYSSLQDAGLKSWIKADLWNIVMAPECITRIGNANRTFTLPKYKKPSPPQLFFDLCCRFISVEERDLHLESELDELGYTLDDWHSALNNIEWVIKNHGENFEDIPSSWLDPLVVVSSFILGQGYGVDYKVEAYAASCGYPRKDLDALMRAAGDRVGYDNRWI
jgi:hypothetical protein|tara:strand:+ start:960 stop:1988 length:1029 start_codon:yes stop_codon:yes gene_type:complete